MSKKSRRRNKKILGVLGALGAAALLGRNKGTAAADVDSGRGGDSSSAVARAIANSPKGTNYPGANKAAAVASAPSSNWISPRMRGKGPQSGSVGQKIRAGLSQPNTTAVAPPSILNPYNPRVHQGRGNFMAKGGRVKGCGKAKRGFGRALKKGK